MAVFKNNGIAWGVLIEDEGHFSSALMIPWYRLRMKEKKIISLSNTDFKLFMKLTKTRGIKKHGMAFLSGPKQVAEVFSEFQDLCAGVIFTDNQEPPKGPATADMHFYRLLGQEDKGMHCGASPSPSSASMDCTCHPCV